MVSIIKVIHQGYWSWRMEFHKRLHYGPILLTVLYQRHGDQRLKSVLLADNTTLGAGISIAY